MIGGSYQGGIQEATKSEDGGWFILSWVPHQTLNSDSLGRGGYPTQSRFQTEEGRTYFIQAERERELRAIAEMELRASQRELKELKDRIQMALDGRDPFERDSDDAPGDDEG